MLRQTDYPIKAEIGSRLPPVIPVIFKIRYQQIEGFINSGWSGNNIFFYFYLSGMSLGKFLLHCLLTFTSATQVVVIRVIHIHLALNLPCCSRNV